MALQGNLRDFAATEILQLLGSQNKTGCLQLEWNTERALVYVHEGRIVSTRRTGMTKDDPLLAFLRKVHRLSDEQYHGILTIQRESNRDLEDLLVNGRYLEEQELAGFVERQVLEDLMRLTRWENGSYRFEPSNRWTQPPLVRLNIEGALIEAARRIDEEKRFVSVFRDPYQVLGLRDLPDPDEPLAEEVRELFGIVNGQNTVSEIVAQASLTEYETYEALHQMLEAQWIEFVGRRDPGRPQMAAVAAAVGPVPKPMSVLRELVMAVLVAGSVFGLHLLSEQFHGVAETQADNDLYVSSRYRQVEQALDLYALEHGRYPDAVEQLTEGRWIAAEQARIPGFVLQYRVVDDGRRYDLGLRSTR